VPNRTNSAPVRDPQDFARVLVAREKAGDADGMPALDDAGAVLDCGSGQPAVGREAIPPSRQSLLRLASSSKLEINAPP
jgi:hypothetical protein